VPGIVSDHRFEVGFSVEFIELQPHDRDQIIGIVS